LRSTATTTHYDDKHCFWLVPAFGRHTEPPFLLVLLIFAPVLTAIAGYTLAVAKVGAKTPASAEFVLRRQEQKAALV
jgi:hypothetical protein